MKTHHVVGAPWLRALTADPDSTPTTHTSQLKVAYNCSSRKSDALLASEGIGIYTYIHPGKHTNTHTHTYKLPLAKQGPKGRKPEVSRLRIFLMPQR